MDLRFALRSFLKQPVFCLTAILTLALGIGANTAIFSVFNGIILRPFPYRDSDRVVMVWQKRPAGQMTSVAGVYYREWVKQATSFEGLGAFIPRTYNVGSGESISQTYGARISANFFSTLGVQPALGRDFVPNEDKPGSEHVAIVTYGLWQSQFGKDPNLLGHPILLNGEPFTLIGVLPQNFEFNMQDMQVWTPLVFETPTEANANKMAVFGKLKRGVSLEQANREMGVISNRLQAMFPEDKGWSADVYALSDMLGTNVRPALTALLVAVGLLLLIACANVANLLLARSDARSREVAIRSALGASRPRLIRQLITETMLLAIAGSLAGLALAYGGLKLLTTVAAGSLPRMAGVGLDARVLVFTALVTIATGVLFGLLPAHQLLGGDLQLALRETGRGSNNAAGGRRSRGILVVSEIALSVMLVIGATLMIQSLLWLQSGNRGYSPEHQLSFRVSLADPELSTRAKLSAYYQRMLDRVKSVPGVEAVAATNNLPVDGYRQVGMYFHVTSAPPEAGEPPSAGIGMINAGYFHALGIPIVRGREYSEKDCGPDSAPVAIISSAIARQFFPGRDPVGEKLTLGGARRGDQVALEIVGVAGDVGYLTKKPSDSEEIYVPYGQRTWPTVYVMVKTAGDPAGAVASIRGALRQSGWHQPITEVETMQQRFDKVNGKVRINSLLAGVFAMVALVLAAVGIYGVISYTVVQRSKEIGIRMALGASRVDIVRWIAGQGMILAAIGVAIGLAGQVALMRVARSLLYGTSANYIYAWIGAAVTLGLVAVLASYVPARRASRSDPAHALRAE